MIYLSRKSQKIRDNPQRCPPTSDYLLKQRQMSLTFLVWIAWRIAWYRVLWYSPWWGTFWSRCLRFGFRTSLGWNPSFFLFPTGKKQINWFKEMWNNHTYLFLELERDASDWAFLNSLHKMCGETYCLKIIRIWSLISMFAGLFPRLPINEVFLITNQRL